MVFDDGLEQRLQIVARLVHASIVAVPGLRVRVEHGKVELVFGGVEIDEQVVDLVQDFLGTRVGTVDLVDDEDGRQLGSSALRST